MIYVIEEFKYILLGVPENMEHYNLFTPFTNKIEIDFQDQLKIFKLYIINKIHFVKEQDFLFFFKRHLKVLKSSSWFLGLPVQLNLNEVHEHKLAEEGCDAEKGQPASNIQNCVSETKLSSNSFNL